jgi:hypothetical protein
MSEVSGTRPQGEHRLEPEAEQIKAPRRVIVDF